MISVKIDDQAGRVNAVYVLEETRNAVVLLVDLNEKQVEVSLWSDRTAYFSGDAITTITLEGDDLGNNPLRAADTSRYTCILTFVRCDGGPRQIYSGPLPEKRED